MTPEEASAFIRDYALSNRSRIVAPPEGILRHPFIKAGIDSYPVLVDWDAIWAGLFFMLEGDTDPLRDSLRNLIEHIDPDGKGQRRIDIVNYSAMPYQIRPFLQTGVSLLSRRIGVDWLDDAAIRKLRNNLLYWHRKRVNKHGLLTWLHVDEGFADNGLQNWAWEGCAVEAVDLNCQIVREHRALAWLLDQRGRAGEAAEHRALADDLVFRIETCLWHEEDGCYYSLYNPPRRFDPSVPIRVKGYTNLWPLWIGITPPERAKRVIENLILNEDEFRSPFGIRSLARSEHCFNNMRHGHSNPMTGAPQSGPVFQSSCSNWQGPIWVVPNYLCVEVLNRYRYRAEARALADQVVIFFAERCRDHGGFHENYHSETGEPLLAPGIVTWNLLLAWLHRHLEGSLFGEVDG